LCDGGRTLYSNTMIREDEEPDVDLDWFAVDSQGSVGHFTTGGCGALPRSAAASRQDLDAVRAFVLGSPETTLAIVNPHRSASIRLFPTVKSEPVAPLRPWTATAARGLYAYDFIDDRRRRPRPYLLVARPELPLHADELPPDIRAIVARTVLRDVVFAHDDVIGMASLL
jgi:hypothetical protein